MGGSGPPYKPEDQARKRREQQREKKQLQDTLKAKPAKDRARKQREGQRGEKQPQDKSGAKRAKDQSPGQQQSGKARMDKHGQRDKGELSKGKQRLKLTLDARNASEKKGQMDQTGSRATREQKSYKDDLFTGVSDRLPQSRLDDQKERAGQTQSPAAKEQKSYKDDFFTGVSDRLPQSRLDDQKERAGQTQSPAAKEQKSHKDDFFTGDSDRLPQSKLGDAGGASTAKDRPRTGSEHQKSYRDYYRWEPQQNKAASSSEQIQPREVEGSRSEQLKADKSIVLTVLEMAKLAFRGIGLSDDVGKLKVGGRPIADVVNGIVDKVAKLAGQELPLEAPNHLKVTPEELARSVKLWSAFLSGGVEFVKARDRGVSTGAQFADGAAAAALDAARAFGGDRWSSARGIKMSPLDNAAQLVHAIASMISPEAAWYTEAFAKAMPSETAKGIATGAIDSIDAAIRGDADQLARQHNRNLRGEYGVAIQGFSIAAEGAGGLMMAMERKGIRRNIAYAARRGDLVRVATSITDTPELNQLDDAAASGRLGMWAKLGTWVGDRVFDATLGLLRRRD